MSVIGVMKDYMVKLRDLHASIHGVALGKEHLKDKDRRGFIFFEKNEKKNEKNHVYNRFENCSERTSWTGIQREQQTEA